MKLFKKIIYITSIILVIVLLYFYLGAVLLPNKSDNTGYEKYFQAISFKYQQKNTVDVMIYGNSDVYSGIVPMQIYENYGIPAYACGIAKQNANAIYKQIEITLKKQKPKLIVIETDCLYYPNNALGGSNKYLNSSLTSAVMYHSRWKELKFSDFFNFSCSTDKLFMKGYIFNNNVSNYQHKQNFMQYNSNIKPLAKSVESDFKKIYNLCKKNNIEIFLIELPSETSWSYTKHNGICDLVNRYNLKDTDYQIKFLDLNLDFDEFIPSQHYRDNGNHCNYVGATIVTTKLSNYITTNYSLTDRRTDEKYSSWNDDLVKFNNYINKQISN